MSLLLVLYLLLLHLCPAITSALSMVKPGCRDRCGNVTVPYPFGLGDNCYREPRYQVFCYNTNGLPKLFNYVGELLDISVRGQLRTLSLVTTDCYDSRGKSIYDSVLLFNSLTSNSIFSISETENKFTAIGCDTKAELTGFPSQQFISGCRMLNTNKKDLMNGSCTGFGCCQTSIPKGFYDFTISVSSYYNHTMVYDYNPCSYAFIVDHNWYNFSISHLFNFTTNFDETGALKVPLVVDWAIDWPKESKNGSCEEVKKDLETYACGKNSVCRISKNDLGYSCDCSQGYHGNPYLPYGCQDINECADPNTNPCSWTCTNLPGSYSCSCPLGYHGDGKKSGSGCIPYTKHPSFTRVIVVSSVLGGVGLAFLFFGSLWLHKVLKKKRKNKLKQEFFERNGGLLLKRQISSEQGDIKATEIFTDDDLRKATDNYNENRILGQGGQGTVYKGMLSDGRIVAIKKSKGVHDQGRIDKFINELIILSQTNHMNVVKLFGCCLETEVPLLVYEFISNGTLFSLLHDKSGDAFSFTWDHRFRIAKEVAEALVYLHSAISTPIYHRDIKSTNILLDDRYRAKVADFGISRSVPIDKSHLTTSVEGTFGYFDPEYYQSSQFTDKSDVYSFGVVLVELLTGEKPIYSTTSEEKRSLVSLFICSMEEDRLFEVLDAQVVEEAKYEELKAIAVLANRCLNMNGKKRPTMKEVATELERLRASPLENLLVQEIKQDED
ncbi:wall-associated receptor kinase 2-like [Macadamia integrifolia]|uniref:wall-associated receptor kinase 2-like n=1 Tax=Macadamia integrifolia TaxID=60698 RepID=UPI001C4EEE18|nr:wall-associated receptor kinase 2-like [Macadamia integrifolia]